MNPHYKEMFRMCMYELIYEYNVKEEWEETDEGYGTDGSWHSNVFTDSDDY